MKLVEIKDTRVGQVLKSDKDILYIVSDYNKPFVPSSISIESFESAGLKNTYTIIGKLGITHRIEDGKLVEIPHTTEFEVDDIVRHENGKTGVIVKINNVGFAIGYEYSINCGSEGFNDTFEYLTKIGILGVTHEFVNDREA